MPLPDPSSSVQAVLRACSILRAFRYNSELLRLRDLVERTGLSKTTVYRLLQTLEQGGLVERADRYAYRVLLSPHRKAELRIGYAAQTTAGTFARLVNDSLMRASMEAGVDLVMVDNRHSASVALREGKSGRRHRVSDS